jgi:hypothetical protein
MAIQDHGPATRGDPAAGDQEVEVTGEVVAMEMMIDTSTRRQRQLPALQTLFLGSCLD